MVKIVIVAVILSVIIFFLRSVNVDFFTPSLIASSIILIYCALSYITEAYSTINEIIKLTGVDVEIYKIIFKIVGISYLIEFSVGTIEDIGFKSIADKVVLIGKLAIFILSAPIFYAIFNLLLGLIK